MRIRKFRLLSAEYYKYNQFIKGASVISKKIELYHSSEDDTFGGSVRPVSPLDVEDVLKSLPYPLIIINTDNYKIEVANEHARKVG